MNLTLAQLRLFQVILALGLLLTIGLEQAQAEGITGYLYTAMTNDTLELIAAEYRDQGVDVTVEQILAQNPILKLTTNTEAGVTVLIPEIGTELFIPGVVVKQTPDPTNASLTSLTLTNSYTANHQYYESLLMSEWKNILIAADKGNDAAKSNIKGVRRILFNHEPDDGIDEVAFFESFERMQGVNTKLLQKQFPDIHLNPDPKTPETFGTRLYFDKREPELVLTTLLKEAEVCKAPAMIVLQVIYNTSPANYPQYDKRILAFYQELAEEGSPRAKLELGIIYGRGLGVAQDDAKAKRMLERNPLLFDSLENDALFILRRIYKEAGEADKLEKLNKEAEEHGLKL